VTTNEARASTLVSALRASVGGDVATLRSLLTEDVKVWTPTFAASSLDDVLGELTRPADTLSDISLEATPLDVGGDFACVEWTVEATHTGELRLGDAVRIAATGIRVTLHGVTVAEFDGDRICALRQYWDELAALDQLGLSPGTPVPAGGAAGDR
jgi:ketosteroid isomerase-like protein